MAEFDHYAARYDGGMEHPLKQWLGRSVEDYVAVKARWLLRDLARRPEAPAVSATACGRTPARILDVGCGVGTLLRQLRDSGRPFILSGCDVSAAMLDEARRRGDGAPPIEMSLIEGGRLPYPQNAFSVVVLCCVVHHVAPADRADLLQEAARVLAPQGRIYVFEHNPRNPLTRRVVRQTAIDRFSQLVCPAEVRPLLSSAGLKQVKTRYLMFVPPRWPFLLRLEDLLTWCPWGAQYVTSAAKCAPVAP